MGISTSYVVLSGGSKIEVVSQWRACLHHHFLAADMRVNFAGGRVSNPEERLKSLVPHSRVWHEFVVPCCTRH